jgi:hypothetical protein
MMRLDISRLEKVRRNPDKSVTCRCPVCAQQNGDSTGNHLRIWQTGAFRCIVDDSKSHNRAIRAYLRNTSPGDNPDEEYIDPEPEIKMDPVYPEESLKRLLPVYDYWLGRGARPEIIRELEGGLSPYDERSKLSDRFLFPVRGLDGRINGYIGRLVSDNSFAPKWKNLVKTSRTVWPWNVTGTSIKTAKTVVLVESPGDLISLLSNDVRNVLCIFGLNLNGKIISTLIANDVKRIVVSLNRDSDPSKGQAAAEKIAGRLAPFWGPKAIDIILPPEGVKDWGCATSEQIAAFKQQIQS